MKPIRVGLLGIGTVGGGTWEVLNRNAGEIRRSAGRAITITQVADKAVSRAKKIVEGKAKVVADAFAVARSPEVDIVEWFGTDRSGDKLTSFVHFTDDDGTRKKSGPRGVVRGGQLFQNPGRFGDKWWSKYHVFSVEWTPKK